MRKHENTTEMRIRCLYLPSLSPQLAHILAHVVQSAGHILLHGLHGFLKAPPRRGKPPKT